MADEGLKFIISAEIAEAVKGLDKVSASIDNVIVEGESLSKAIDQANKSLASISSGANKSVQGFDEVSTSLAEVALAKNAFDSAFSRTDGNMHKIFADIDKQADAARAKIAAMAEAALRANDPLFDLQKNVAHFGGGVKVFKSSVESATPSLDKFKTVTNRANQSLIDIGRIVQDAPYGFIGIANNINPAIESFQRLRAETGSNKAALSALLGSLTGPGGIGIALSLITSALSFVTLGMSAWTRGFGSNTEKAEKNKDAIQRVITEYEKFIQKLNEVIVSLSTESSKVQLIFTALGEANTPLAKRKQLIEELQQLSPKYLGSLDAEKSGYEEIRKSVDLYLDSLAKQAQLKALLPEFEKIVQKIVKAQVELNQLKQPNVIDSLFGADEDYNKEVSNRLNNIIRVGKKEIEVAKKALTQIAGGGENLVDILFGKDLDKKDPAKKIKDTTDDLIRRLEALKKAGLLAKFELNKLLDLKIGIALKKGAELGLSQREIQAEITDLINKSEIHAQVGMKIGIDGKRVSVVQTDFEKIRKAINTTLALPDGQMSLVPKAQVNEGALEIDKLTAAFLRLKGVTSTLQLNTKLKTQLDEITTAAEETKKIVNNTIRDIISGSLANIGDAIGAAIMGDSGGLRDAFKGIGLMLASGARTIGEQLIKFGVMMKVAQLSVKKLLTNPGLAIVAGIGLIALSSVMQRAFASQATPFAKGGVVTGPTLGLVGEAGPEVIFPLSQLNRFVQDMQGTGSNSLQGEFRLDGSDLVLAYRRASNQYGSSIRP